MFLNFLLWNLRFYKITSLIDRWNKHSDMAWMRSHMLSTPEAGYWVGPWPALMRIHYTGVQTLATRILCPTRHRLSPRQATHPLWNESGNHSSLYSPQETVGHWQGNQPKILISNQALIVYLVFASQRRMHSEAGIVLLLVAIKYNVVWVESRQKKNSDL